MRKIIIIKNLKTGACDILTIPSNIAAGLIVEQWQRAQLSKKSISWKVANSTDIIGAMIESVTL